MLIHFVILNTLYIYIYYIQIQKKEKKKIEVNEYIKDYAGL